MNDNIDDRLRCRQLENLGRLMAGFSHDLKNHLAIIKESIGLLDDAIAMGAIENTSVAEKLKRIVVAIERRVGLADGMAQHLNSFSHRMDSPLSTFRVNDAIQEELSFLSRFARLKNISIDTELEENIPHMHNNPSLLQFMFFELFFQALNRFQGRGRIVVSSAHADKSVLVGLKLCDLGTGVEFLELGTNAELLLYAAEKTGTSINTSVPENESELITLRLQDMPNS